MENQIPGLRFHHYMSDVSGLGMSDNQLAVLKAFIGDQEVGHLAWDKEMVQNIFVNPSNRGQGIGSRLAEEALRIHQSGAVFEPKISPFRTDEGQRLAASLGKKHNIPVIQRRDSLFPLGEFHRQNYLVHLRHRPNT